MLGFFSFESFFLLTSDASGLFCPEPQQHGVVTPPLGRHTETAKHVVECPSGCRRQESVHGDGGDEARGCAPYHAHKELHYNKRYGSGCHIYEINKAVKIMADSVYSSCTELVKGVEKSASYL